MDSTSRMLMAVTLGAASLLAPGRARAQQPAHLGGEDSAAVERATLADPRVRAIVGAGAARVIIGDAELDKREAQAFLEDTTAPPPTRRVAVVVFNARSNRAARALVSLPQHRILAVERLAPAEVPFVRADAEEALAIAKASAVVRRAVGDSLDRFVLANPGEESPAPLAAEVLPVRSVPGRDPCAVDRCLDVIFRTTSGYLPLRAHVDLTRRTVTVQQRRTR